MKILPYQDLRDHLSAMLVESGQQTQQSVDRVFPNMIRSGSVLVFDRSYFYDHFNPHWTEWLEAVLPKNRNGQHYIEGSGMCEVGTHWAIGQLHESVIHYLGSGDVEEAIIREATRRGYGDRVPRQRLGDATPGAFNTNIELPKGTSLNGVTDGGHSTLMALVADATAPTEFGLIDMRDVVVMKWEWQNLRWSTFGAALAAGVKYKDIGS